MWPMCQSGESTKVRLGWTSWAWCSTAQIRLQQHRVSRHARELQIGEFFVKRGLKKNKIRKRAASWRNLEKWVPPAR
jgi:hypothetical protein